MLEQEEVTDLFALEVLEEALEHRQSEVGEEGRTKIQRNKISRGFAFIRQFLANFAPKNTIAVQTEAER